MTKKETPRLFAQIKRYMRGAHTAEQMSERLPGAKEIADRECGGDGYMVILSRSDGTVRILSNRPPREQAEIAQRMLKQLSNLEGALR
jgi:hypothetical protein